MSGETNLAELLKTLSPELLEGQFVFLNFPEARYGDHTSLDPIAAFMEVEGLTLVVAQSKADQHGLLYETVFSAITLNVHSSLDAIGLTAAFATKLTEHSISANVFAGYFHDHLFVQSEHAKRAVTVLRELSSPNQA